MCPHISDASDQCRAHGMIKCKHRVVTETSAKVIQLTNAVRSTAKNRRAVQTRRAIERLEAELKTEEE
jgi:hypothetical protein